MASLLKVKKVVNLDAGFLLESVLPRLGQTRPGAFQGVLSVCLQDAPSQVNTLHFQTGQTHEGNPAQPADVRWEITRKDVEAVLGGKSRGAGVLQRVTLEARGGLPGLRALCMHIRPTQKPEPVGGARDLGSDDRARPYVLKGKSGVLLKAVRPASASAAPPVGVRTVTIGKTPASDPVEFATANLASFLEDACVAVEKATQGQPSAQGALLLQNAQVFQVLPQGNVPLGELGQG